jgi:site-specific DNA-methyltransferase (adenine-specific)
MRLGRHAVGIDLSGVYTTGVVRKLLEAGAARSDWETLIGRLGETPPGFASWRGNKKNFRKPGQVSVAHAAEQT